MEQRSQIPQDEALSLCRLPTDILRKILKKLALKDRLRLELVDKKHRDALREPELWYEIDLATMQALDLTADQLLHLLSRVHPDIERLSSQAQSMAEILHAVSDSFMKDGFDFWRDVDVEVPNYYGKDVVSIAARSFGRLHHQVPESWGATRYLVETCTIWFSEQVQRLLTVGPWMRGLWVASLKIIRDPDHFLKKLEARLDTLRNPDRKSQLKPKSKVDVSLDVSGAGNLAPAFLAACIVALAAARFKVSFRMTGNGDPSFPAHRLLDLLRTLALDCSICVNVGVSGTYRPMTPLLEAATQLGEEDTASATSTVDVASLADRIAVAYKSEYKGSEAAYRKFVTQIQRLLELREQIEVDAGRSNSCQEKTAEAKFACETFVFENLFSVTSTLLDDFYQYLHDPPSNLRLVFRNCLLIHPEDFRSLAELLERCGATSLAFQQTELPKRRRRWNTQSAEPILGSVALQDSPSLQLLDLDLPLFLPDVDTAISFLTANKHGATIVFHVRPRFYARDRNQAQQLFSKLRDLCASAHGNRVRVVQHTGGNRILTRGVSGTVGSSPSEGSLISPGFQQEIDTRLRFKRFVRILDYVFLAYCTVDLYRCIANVAFILRFKPSGYLDSPPPALIMSSVSLGLIWRPIRATLLGRRDYIGIVLGTCMVLVPFPVIKLAFALFVLYLVHRLAWTIAGKLVDKIV